MGVARLLAKGWVVLCLFAGAHAFNAMLLRGELPVPAGQAVAVCVALFGAMGLFFIAGFGAAPGPGVPSLRRLKPRDFVPLFDDVVFLVFVAASFTVQIWAVSPALAGPVSEALQRAMYFVVPGQHALAAGLIGCGYGHATIFAIALASAFAWLLAIVFVASAVSRVRLTAGLLRMERTLRPSIFGPTLLAVLYGLVAIVSFQLLYVGSAYPWLDCGVFTLLPGQILIGLVPLLLAYLVVAALVTLRASAPDEST